MPDVINEWVSTDRKFRIRIRQRTNPPGAQIYREYLGEDEEWHTVDQVLIPLNHIWWTGARLMAIAKGGDK